MIHISSFSCEIDNSSLLGVLQNGPKPQLSILNRQMRLGIVNVRGKTTKT